MKVELTESFLRKLNRQVAYIAKDKPLAARKFKNDLISKVRKIGDRPYINRKSIYFDDNHIRDLIFKGYTIVYLIATEENSVIVFGLIKYEDEMD